MTGRNSSNAFIPGFRQGSFTSVRELYTLHYSSLLFFAKQLIQDHQESEYIVMDTFVKLLQRRDRFDSLPNIKAFLYITTRNTCLHFLQSQHKPAAGDFAVAGSNNSGDVDMNAVADDVMQLLYSIVEQLPVQCREVFRRWYQNGEYLADIAMHLHIHPQQVLQQRTAAVHTLQQRLAEKTDHSPLVLIYFLAVVYPGTKLVKVA